MWFNIFMKNKVIARIINYILEKRRNRLEKTLEQLKPRVNKNIASKTLITASEIIALTGKTEEILNNLDDEVKNIVKVCLNNPYKLLQYVEEHSTNVYKIPYANKFLALVGEEEGFIVPSTGVKALYLSFITNLFAEKKLKISFSTPEMFVLRDMEINVYYMLHQFHKWYGFKKNLPGYDEKAQKLFKENLNTMTDGADLTIDEILALKDAIARDAQAAEFVIQLAKESEGAKNVLGKIKKDGSAEI